jgi:hypothetical protein
VPDDRREAVVTTWPTSEPRREIGEGLNVVFDLGMSNCLGLHRDLAARS